MCRENTANIPSYILNSFLNRLSNDEKFFDRFVEEFIDEDREFNFRMLYKKQMQNSFFKKQFEEEIGIALEELVEKYENLF